MFHDIFWTRSAIRRIRKTAKENVRIPSQNLAKALANRGVLRLLGSQNEHDSKIRRLKLVFLSPFTGCISEALASFTVRQKELRR